MIEIIKKLKEDGCICEENVSHTEKYLFSSEEFILFIEQILNQFNKKLRKKYRLKQCCFETYFFPFEIDEEKYYLEEMTGQGTVYSLFTKTEGEKEIERLKELFVL